MYSPEDVPKPVYDPAEVERFPAPVRRWYESWQAVPAEQKHRFRCQYLGDVTLLDEQIGRVLSQLTEYGWDANTLIIFSSDHGDYLGDHGMLQKGFFHECSARVPLIFKGSGIPSGRVVNAPVTLAELKSTVLDYANLIEPECNPDSFMSAFCSEGSKLDRHRMAVSETGIHGQGMMVRLLNQKYCYYPQTEQLEWYDLTDDPYELNNRGVGKTLADLPEVVVSKFREVLKMSERHVSKQYKFACKWRAMFT